MTIRIRPARPEDLDWLLAQLRQFSDFFGSKRPLLGDEAYARDQLSLIMRDHLMLIADGEGVGPVGFTAGLLNPHFFNPDIRVLAEAFWWVDHDHRGSRAASLLMDAFIDWGREHADWITFALQERTRIKDQSLIKRGFKRQEKNFLMEIA